MSTWKIDQAHSHIEFKVKHMVVSTLGGHFGKFDATMECGKDDFTDAHVTFEADVDSITTGQEQRDGHLKSDDFFNVAQYPKLKFISTGIHKTSEHDYKLTGDLTIRDKTVPITLDVNLGGIAQNFSGQTFAGFELNGKISRKQFDLKWNAVTEAGSVVVSDDVKLHINVEMVKQG